jgi:hypothetical protein
MWKIVPAFALILSTTASGAQRYRQQPCKTPDIATSCFRTHARLSAGNGTPAVRLWPIGSHHLYGIYSNRYGMIHDSSTLDNEGPKLPDLVLKHISHQGGWRMYGDFEVCPLEPPKQGHMQAACIAGASNVVAPKD